VGTVVFVFGQYFLKLVLEPAVELRKVIANVATALTEYCNLYSNAGSTLDFLVAPSIDASKNIRRLAAQLQAQAYTVVGYRFVQKFFALPPRGDVIKAVSELIGLSNSFPGSSAIALNQAFLNIKTQNQVERLLRIYNAAGPIVSAQDEINGTIRLMSKQRRFFRNSTGAPSNSGKASGDA
jgi:hypothetical protein